MLSENELLDIDGGVCGIDDGLLLTAFFGCNGNWRVSRC